MSLEGHRKLAEVIDARIPIAVADHPARAVVFDHVIPVSLAPVRVASVRSACVTLVDSRLVPALRRPAVRG